MNGCYQQVHFQMSNTPDGTNQMQQILGGHRIELKDLPTRKYLDETVVPILTEGLAILGKVNTQPCRK